MTSILAKRVLKSVLGLGKGLLLAAGLWLAARADSVVVFNEIMYHPRTNEAALEWVELHNQMAVDVDLSGWSLAGGIQFSFSEGTLIPGGGYLVVAASPTELAAQGVANVLGPFAGRLSNNGDRLQLRSNTDRLMDEVNYGVDGDWPVGPDGAGVSLAKRDGDAASGPSRNWTVSALVGGTPGSRNFAAKSFETVQTTAVTVNGTWRYDASGSDLGTAWRETGFDDRAWASGNGLFQAGNVTSPLGDPEPIPTLFSSGMGDDGVVLSPGLPDPHYLLTQSAQSTPPPPSIPATVIQNHPAWAANSTASSWIGPVNPGAVDVAAGVYNYRTAFNLDGFNPATAQIAFNFGADNSLNDVLLNGVSRGISYEGFSSLSGAFPITTGFVAGTNTLDFIAANAGDGPNPAGFRVQASGTARRQFLVGTPFASGPTCYYFRKAFALNGAPHLSALTLNAIVADGAVFYLNGTEVLRLNLPAGTITAATLAGTNVPNPGYVGPFPLPVTSLVTGTNVLAVEIHPAPGSTNDILFGADLSVVTTNILVPPPVRLAFNEVASATNAEFWVELANYGATDIDLEGFALARFGGATNRSYTFPAQPLPAGAFLQVDKATLGFAADPGDRLVLYSPYQESVLDAVVAKRQSRGRWPDGTGLWWYPTSLTPGESNHFELHDEVVVNEIMYHAPGASVPAAEANSVTVLPITAAWRYNQSGADLGASWVLPGFDDSAWPVGDGLLYVEESALPAPKNTPLSLGVITYYFRAPFLLPRGTSGLELSLRGVIDDGAVFYLNGTAVHRLNLPDEGVNYLTPASPSVTDAVYSEPVLLPLTNLVAGTNWLAVEVHQTSSNSTDIVFGAELIATYLGAPAIPFQESPESWVELYNRSTNAVNLAGWRLAHDLDYAFPTNATLPAGGYLVVAKDVGFMQTNYPEVTVLGPFSGNLRRSGSHLLLLDPAGNPADEVRYYDGKPWPAEADGGGCSLELRDPSADNAQASAWAASNEAGHARWSNYTYKAVARNVLGGIIWREFVMGLLDAGECLIDDLSVVESPSGTPVQMLQNGTFETGLTAWRALGTHNRSRIESDPDTPSNHVLHLVATGPTEHMHNHLETTLAGGRSVTDGREYQVSFRAKWLSGNPRLNTRLYFNRVAKTTALAVPQRHGTPGQRNSTYLANAGPTFQAFAHSPILPEPGQPVTVSVAARDPQGVGKVALWWSVNGGGWNNTLMTAGGAASTPGYTNYFGMIAGLPAGSLVQFFVRANDSLGVAADFPAAGINSRALYRVDEDKPTMSLVHRVRLLMPPADAEALHASTNVMSNDRVGLTVVYDEREVFYDVGVHLQGSERGRNDSSRVGFTVAFNRDHLFRGVHDGFAADKSGGYSGLAGKHDEILLWHAVNHAGGMPGMYNDLMQVFAPRAQEDGTAQVRLAAYGPEFLDSQYKDGSDGNVYKLELIYYPTTTVNGNPESPKMPQPDEVVDVDFRNWGDDAEAYRWMFRQDNHSDRDDYSQLIALNKALSLTGTAFDTQTSQLMDVDEWMRSLSFLALIGAGDIFSYGLNHNLMLYFRPEDNKAMALLFDMDYEFVQSIDYAYPGAGSANTYRLTILPNNYRRYCNHLLDIMTTTVNEAYLRPWAARYAGRLGQNWDGAVNYLVQRAAYVRNRMPLTTPFAITSNAGRDYSVNTNRITLVGTAPLTVKDIEINGRPTTVTWTTLTNWSVSVALTGYTNLLSLQGVNNDGSRPSKATDTITVTNLTAPALLPVVINEWMADNAEPGGLPDPADGKRHDWFELYNPNSVAVDLSGCFLTDTPTLPKMDQVPANTFIAPLGFLLVWADGLTNQNGGGGLHVSFQLGKNGDTITLSSTNGTLQHSVTFGPQAANVSQGLYPDGNVTTLHSMSNWTPGASNSLDEPASPELGGFAWQAGGALSFEVGTVPGRSYRVEFKEDLNASVWLPLTADRVATGTTLTVTDPTSGPAQRFYRVILLQ